MGRKEQAKKAKRVAAALAEAPPGKAVAPQPPVAATPTTGSGSRASSASSASLGDGWVLTPVAPSGSGNPSCVSSGVEAGRGSYKEGVGGLYTCAGCGARPLRSAFLIEATDLEGNLCVERDWQGRLYGRCYDCCRGRGCHGGDDMYADLVQDGALEETLWKTFKKECHMRHMRRNDVKDND